jgi:hypothetical protein
MRVRCILYVRSHATQLAALFWKTSQPGGCDLKMLHDLPSRTDFWQTYEGIQYNWRHFESWDDRARAVFGGEGARSSNSYTYLLDLQPLHLRADAHSGSRPGVCVCVCVCLCVSLSLCLCLCVCVPCVLS